MRIDYLVGGQWQALKNGEERVAAPEGTLSPRQQKLMGSSYVQGAARSRGSNGGGASGNDGHLQDGGRGLHTFPFPLNLSLPCPFQLNVSSLCPPYDPNYPVDISSRFSS
jgi:hypothetical protein